MGTGPPKLRAAVPAASRVLVFLGRRLGDIRAYPPAAHAGVGVVRPPDQSAAVTQARAGLAHRP